LPQESRYYSEGAHREKELRLKLVITPIGIVGTF
jgi:hypothetical protein